MLVLSNAFYQFIKKMTAIDQQDERRIIKLLNLKSVIFLIMGLIGVAFSFMLIIAGVEFNFIFFDDPVKALSTDLDHIDDFEAWYFIFFLYIFSNAVFRIINGVLLRRKLHRSYSVFISFYGLIGFPVGTALGIFSLIVLTREKTKVFYLSEKEKQIENRIYSQ